MGALTSEEDFPEPVCDENNTKHFLFRMMITNETHKLLNGVVYAVGYAGDSLYCFTHPRVVYSINNTGECTVLYRPQYIGPPNKGHLNDNFITTVTVV